jgi:hypothetical protein
MKLQQAGIIKKAVIALVKGGYKPMWMEPDQDFLSTPLPIINKWWMERTYATYPVFSFYNEVDGMDLELDYALGTKKFVIYSYDTEGDKWYAIDYLPSEPR